MDHNGLLECIRAMAEVAVSRERAEKGQGWRWAVGVLIEPELRCPKCKAMLRTTGWFWRIRGPRLLGQFEIKAGGRAKLGRAFHPHEAGGNLCKGTAKDYIHGFVSIYPQGAMRSNYECFQWFQKFCQHECLEWYQYLGTDPPPHLRPRPLTAENLNTRRT